MKFHKTPLKGNYLIELDRIQDERGFFARYFCEKEFSKFNLNSKWVQINNSLSKNPATLRGLHFQNQPHAEIKLIRCIKGKIFDVVVDIRKNSKTFGKWFGSELTEDNRNMMYVPEGFAHGFVSLTEDTEIIYLVSKFYSPNAEQTLMWNDPEVDVQWPVKPSVVSKKDQNGLFLKDLQLKS